jgi:cytoplasmic iron level regulating protein YaaA (DUF328/UPF0246 family)
MKLIISPAKSMDMESKACVSEYTIPEFLDKTERINKILKKKSPKSLSKLMHISPKLAELNWERNQNFNLPFTNENAKQALFAFTGDVYQGIEAHSLTKKSIVKLQEQLFILSGLYGIVKPLDLIQAYRLEMGTKMAIGSNKNLYEFWKKTLTKYINTSLLEGECLVNLASNEYSSAIDLKNIKNPVITPVFKDWKNDQLKMISFFAKKARGSLVRFIAENEINTPRDLLAFNTDGYRYSEQHTQKEDQPVFIR